MRIAAPLFVCIGSFALSACLVRTAAEVVTAPVRVGSKAVDLATTSQSEADEKRGREIRKREERLGTLERRYDQEITRCRDGDDAACDAARATYAELRQTLPTIPAEPEDD
ncbi:hypothetical protein [Erythrobacter sp. JK5]|uniref:hypothetical protein n=1 Tax=Erythrobacter sp. JK5 TaxID=2829500 RepID=UPI001BA730B9|nr:hypothetical protein [Erythrobacter sp. JK5]QUL37295.1 hypothetical protein KDC96_13075 [Erythrobacter sp. JK5]